MHFGEEPSITGTNGSGTIFFAGCNMGCIYCQNYPISQLKSAYRRVTPEELANEMLKLQRKKAHNINLVTPSHFVHLICDAIEMAKEKGLTIPIVYNTSSYDTAEVIRLMKDCIDIYLADLKYVDARLSFKLSGVKDYFEVATSALKAMYETKGSLKIESSLATKGLLVRHLILPGHLENSKSVLKWIEQNLPGVPVSIMFQYFPAYKAIHLQGINRKLTQDEYNEIIDFISNLNIDGFLQEFDE